MYDRPRYSMKGGTPRYFIPKYSKIWCEAPRKNMKRYSMKGGTPRYFIPKYSNIWCEAPRKNMKRYSIKVYYTKVCYIAKSNDPIIKLVELEPLQT